MVSSTPGPAIRPRRLRSTLTRCARCGILFGPKPIPQMARRYRPDRDVCECCGDGRGICRVEPHPCLHARLGHRSAPATARELELRGRALLAGRRFSASGWYY